MRKKLIMRIVSMILSGMWALGFTAQVQAQIKGTDSPSEIKMDRYEIYPTFYDAPFPVGDVDVNPVFLHYRKKYADEKLRNKEKMNNLYYFRMARNTDMKKPEFESGARRWSFYCPYQKLEKGTWFWQCGMATIDSPDKITWSAKYSFVISGNEREVKWPHYKVLKDALLKNGHPRILCLKPDIGNLMPEDKKLAADLQKALDVVLKKPMPTTFMDFSKWKDPSMRKSGTTDAQKASYLIGDFETLKLMPVIRGYLLTGDKRYLNEGLAAFDLLVKGYKELSDNKLGVGFVTDSYGRSLINIFDSFYNEIEKDRRDVMLVALKESAEKTFDELLDGYEHIPHNEHRWQSYIRSSIFQAMALLGEVDEASEWLEYLYDLWNLKMPGAGRNCGGWYTGNGYFNASVQTQSCVPYVLSRHTGVDFFDHPWYHKVGKYLCYTSLPYHPSGGYGDKAGGYTEEGAPMIDLVRNLRFIHPDNPWNQRYYETIRPFCFRSEAVREYLESEPKWFELQLRKQRPEVLKNSGYMKVTEQAALFNDVGYVAMASDMDNIEKNATISFRSCPYGQSNHAHAAQNAFDMTWQGRKLFFSTGYYTSSNDPFSVQCYKHSRAHNTILADGMGTSMAHSGYGWIARFLNSDKIAYSLGDASNAFTGEYGPYAEMLIDRGVPVTPENGFGNPGVTRFRRHIVYLRPYILLVYDELEAKKPVTWTFQLNADDPITRIDDSSAAVKNSKATATVKLYTLTGSQCIATDKFYVPANDFQRKLPTTRNQGHATINTKTKTDKERLLTVIRINPGETDATKPLNIRQHSEGSGLNLEIDGWSVFAEMDPTRPSLLTVMDNEGQNAILTGSNADAITVAGKAYKVDKKGMTLLLEKKGKEFVKQQAKDKLPDAAVYNQSAAQ